MLILLLLSFVVKRGSETHYMQTIQQYYDVILVPYTVSFCIEFFMPQQ